MLKQQLSKFIIVGLLCTAVNYFVFFVSLNYLAINYLIASAVGFVSGVFIGFFLNKNWTFNSKEVQSHKIMLGYFSVYLVSLLISLLFLRVTVGTLGVSPEIANFLAICITTCTNFAGTKFFVFRK